MKSKNVALKKKVSAKAKPKPAPAARKTAPPAFEPLHLPKGVLLGAHTSTAGGVSQAVPRAQACGFTAAQIFVKNNKQWFAPPLAKDEITAFLTARKASGIVFFAHNSYLINLASQDPKMFDTSVKAMIAELERAEALELPFIVMHPGSHGGAGEEAGLERIAQGLEKIIAATPKFRCKMALEITAGQGTALGYKLEQLAWLSTRVADESRLGFCLDTAHLFAAGYNLKTAQGYQDLIAEIKKTIGIERILGLHLNDSKVPLGKRVDRHEHLGDGEVGLDCFIRIVQDKKWAK
ncbi:MAG TPA: deoxyribonuclease IV, partial [Candidatus Methylacidiphilales bacterium]|nr:deoxyribonuclease IV [Candidatus Methylacidiphilales bacterium]